MRLGLVRAALAPGRGSKCPVELLLRYQSAIAFGQLLGVGHGLVESVARAKGAGHSSPPDGSLGTCIYGYSGSLQGADGDLIRDELPIVQRNVRPCSSARVAYGTFFRAAPSMSDTNRASCAARWSWIFTLSWITASASL